MTYAAALCVPMVCTEGGTRAAQQAALLARGARRHDSRKSEVSAVAEDLLNASHSHKYASGGDPPEVSSCIAETRTQHTRSRFVANTRKVLPGLWPTLRDGSVMGGTGDSMCYVQSCRRRWQAIVRLPRLPDPRQARCCR